MKDDILNYVINLHDRSDRRAEMNEQLRRIGWMAQFSNSDREADLAGFPSIGAHGCFKSHLATLRRGCIMKGHVLIMEDDLNFVPGFSGLWKESSEQLAKTDWDIFYPAHLLNISDGLVSIEPATEILCAHFLMFNRKAVPRIIAGLETILSRPPGHPDGGPMHVDGAYATIRKQNPDLKTYVFSPSLGYQRSSRSDIANVKFFDRIEVLRPTIRVLRRIKRML